MHPSNGNENLKRFKKIPLHVVEEHNDALQFIYSAIGGKKLPVEGTTLLHLDSHPDMLIDRKLKGDEARSGRKVLELLEIENWIVPAAAAGHLSRVVWIRPPWAKQLADGTRVVNVGDHPATGFLRVDSIEPYYLSDALYSSQLVNKRKFIFTVAELNNTNEFDFNKLYNDIGISHPYILDIDLDFFSTANPFLSLYENIGLYDRIGEIFHFSIPDTDDVVTLDNFVQQRERQLDELEELFSHLDEHGSLNNYAGIRSKYYNKVSDLVPLVTAEAERLGERPDWWAIHAAGCTKDGEGLEEEGLPHHISPNEHIMKTIEQTLCIFLKGLPPPVLITLARSSKDGYCPPDQVDFIQTLVIELLKELYVVDEPNLHYLNEDIEQKG
ncbi:unnamed protein product [Leptidea sinapis]|uniref:Uncharacterized protein n=1 Tax=Leptidea sinapis TaxID=189913 RepID=A0A5E4QTV4_9NEOP|nr:unnamed protein product [Leptidea sinapis]